MKYESELKFAKALASQAKEIALKYYKTNLDIITKSDKSPVTIADETINELVITAVQEQYPDYGVLGEERSWQLDKNMLWVCDPIDGTVAFSIGEPTFMFSLALVDDGKPVFALTSDLANGDTFWASLGEGAYMNDKPMHVSNRELNEGWLAFPTNINVLSKHQSMYINLANLSKQYIMIHGMVFKGMLIAQGLCDAAAWPNMVKPWDAAAVKLIIEEAGGKVSNIKDEEQRFDGELLGGMVMSNSVTHGSVISIMQKSMA